MVIVKCARIVVFRDNFVGVCGVLSWGECGAMGWVVGGDFSVSLCPLGLEVCDGF